VPEWYVAGKVSQEQTGISTGVCGAADKQATGTAQAHAVQHENCNTETVCFDAHQHTSAAGRCCKH